MADSRAKFNKPPSVYAVPAYDTAQVIVDALNQTQGGVSDKDKLAQVIGGIKVQQPAVLSPSTPAPTTWPSTSTF